jgi:hypothetical protein
MGQAVRSERHADPGDLALALEQVRRRVVHLVFVVALRVESRGLRIQHTAAELRCQREEAG